MYTPTPAAIVAAFQTRYRDAMLRAWMRRTKRDNSYRAEDVPAYITVPTNEQRSAQELVEFVTKPLAHGKSYVAYMAPGRMRITTWMGEMLAYVTHIKSRPNRCGYTTSERGSFWARGIDGRLYYGTHNGPGMYCRMRLAKKQPWVVRHGE